MYTISKSRKVNILTLEYIKSLCFCCKVIDTQQVRSAGLFSVSVVQFCFLGQRFNFWEWNTYTRDHRVKQSHSDFLVLNV